MSHKFPLFHNPHANRHAYNLTFMKAVNCPYIIPNSLYGFVKRDSFIIYVVMRIPQYTFTLKLSQLYSSMFEPIPFSR